MIIFDSTKHAYTNSYTGDAYTSVTTILGRFKPEFDADKFSRIVADRKGVSQQTILDEWKANNKQSQVYGTNIHHVIEEYAKTGFYEDENKDVITAYQEIGDYSTKSGALFEHCVYNHEYKIAGTADIIYPQGSYFDVYDFKTNKKFNFFSKYEKFLLGPVSHLPDCEYSNYCLQLSLYAYNYHIMTGRKVRSLKIFYWDRDAKTFTAYPVPYLLSDIKNILKSL
jgi:hypothetical protein|tara:strand:- start:1227 stop:1901 length:675 start_codon:yes stop_codon:yes gene_type:complete